MASRALAREFTNGHLTAVVQSEGGHADDQQPARVLPVPSTSGGGSGSGTLARLAAGAFLPEGFPDSVSSDYLGYQLWDSIQGLSSYVRGMLSSQAMLAGVGVGSAAATPLGAVFQFFVKDMSGMVGGILFASTQGSGLDCYAKQWRLFGDVMNDIGMALELASPLLPGAFLLLACLGSIARAVTGVAGGATRMALTQHFAQARNAADIAAKEGSQETAVTLVGMVLGMVLIRLAAGHPALTWAAFWALTAVHVWANVRAMRCLRITGINQARLGLLLRHYLCQGVALTPAQLAERESLVAPPLQRLLRLLGLAGLAGARPQVALAPRLASLSTPLQRQLAAELAQAAQQGSGRRYIAAATAGAAGPAGPDAVLLLHREAAPADILQGYCAALMLAWRAQLGHGRGPSKLWPDAARRALADPSAWFAGSCSGGGGQPAGSTGSGGEGGGGSKDSDSGGYAGFVEALAAAGWNLERVALLQGQARLVWGGADLHTD
ncbi:hypothetical protein ABPG75_010671 [Micractinium tetrahymenae]